MTRGPLRPVSPTVGLQKEFLELIFRFHGTLRRLQLQEPEYVLMAATALFSPGEPRPGSFGPRLGPDPCSLNPSTQAFESSTPGKGCIPASAARNPATTPPHLTPPRTPTLPVLQTGPA